MNPEFAEEASIDGAIGRKPDATVSMEIDTSGRPTKLQVSAASLPMWGEDAVRTLTGWQFHPATDGATAVPVSCIIELAWYAPH